MRNLGIVVSCYNRPEYLKKTLDCLDNTIYDYPTMLYLSDDNSTDMDTIKIRWEFYHKYKIWYRTCNNNKNLTTFVCSKGKHCGVAETIRFGLEFIRMYENTVFCILDSDTLTKPEWLNKELELLQKFPSHIITGFNSNNTKKHKILAEHEDYYEKRTANGVNYMFGMMQIDNVMKALEYGNAWDQHLCSIMIREEKKSFISTKPSVVQHIGEISSENLQHKPFEYAIDY